MHFGAGGDGPCYLFLDNFHLLKDEKRAKFFCADWQIACRRAFT